MGNGGNGTPTNNGNKSKIINSGSMTTRQSSLKPYE
jgi:hypothetical protein